MRGCQALPGQSPADNGAFPAFRRPRPPPLAPNPGGGSSRAAGHVTPAPSPRPPRGVGCPQQRWRRPRRGHVVAPREPRGPSWRRRSGAAARTTAGGGDGGGRYHKWPGGTGKAGTTAGEEETGGGEGAASPARPAPPVFSLRKPGPPTPRPPPVPCGLKAPPPSPDAPRPRRAHTVTQPARAALPSLGGRRGLNGAGSGNGRGLHRSCWREGRRRQSAAPCPSGSLYTPEDTPRPAWRRARAAGGLPLPARCAPAPPRDAGGAAAHGTLGSVVPVREAGSRGSCREVQSRSLTARRWLPLTPSLGPGRLWHPGSGSVLALGLFQARRPRASAQLTQMLGSPLAHEHTTSRQGRHGRCPVTAQPSTETSRHCYFKVKVLQLQPRYVPPCKNTASWSYSVRFLGILFFLGIPKPT